MMLSNAVLQDPKESRLIVFNFRIGKREAFLSAINCSLEV